MMNFDCFDQLYPSSRYPVMARRGMVCTGSALASSAGLEILRQGGNAIDAAIATAAALTVVEPAANGLGSDAFAIVWHKNELFGLNSSGFAPEAISADRIKAQGQTSMPTFGWTPVTVPGAVKAWKSLNERFGKLTLAQCLVPASRYAEEGYPCPPVLSHYWRVAYDQYRKEFAGKPEFDEWFKTFAPEGCAPQPGDVITLKNHAKTLREIGETQTESFYHGKLADQIDACSRQYGGYLRKADLEAFENEWVTPIRMNYRGYEICELPPNGQGIIALMALNILKEFQFTEKLHVETVHRQLEAMKMAFKDGLFYITDPKAMKVKTEQLLDPKLGPVRAAQITDWAQDPQVSKLPQSGTVYLCTADEEGNMVSYIQSNYMGFGSGIVVDGTGIALQNRGRGFSLDEKHANYLEPRKRTYHTIIPGFMMKDGKAIGPFGVMGGHMQPQGHVQVAMNLIDFHLNPQMALDAPRWLWKQDNRILVEPHFPASLAKALQRRGHRIEVSLDPGVFGRGQMILRKENGTLIGGTESRTDSNIACY